MNKNISISKSIELNKKKEWCLLIINFLQTISGTRNVVFEDFIEIINNLHKSGNLKGLNQVYKDVNEWALSLNKASLENLNAILFDKFKENLDSVKNINEKKINTIIKRGKINNEEESRLVSTFIEYNLSDNILKPKVVSLEKLLFDFYSNNNNEQ